MIFGLSFALHAIALAWVKGVDHPAPAVSQIIFARLRLDVEAPAISSTPNSRSTAEALASAVQAAAPRSAKPLPSRRDQVTATAAAAAAVPPMGGMEAAAPDSAPLAESPAAGTGAATPAPTQSVLLGAYRQRLTELLAGQQHYPRVAAQRGWEGEVRLRLQVARKGNLVSVQLDRSSGFEVLDQHALAMLEQLASLPPLPEGLDASEIQVVVPVNYRLRKAT
jgi:protein TonB